jgi:hypothetical protein
MPFPRDAQILELLREEAVAISKPFICNGIEAVRQQVYEEKLDLDVALQAYSKSLRARWAREINDPTVREMLGDLLGTLVNEAARDHHRAPPRTVLKPQLHRKQRRHMNQRSPRIVGKVCRNHGEIVDALRARKDELGLSDSFVDDIGGFAHGHVGKIIGPSRLKGLGRSTIDRLLNVLGVSLLVVVDDEKMRQLKKRHERRAGMYVSENGRVAKLAIKRARPAVLKALGQLGGHARSQALDGKRRSEIARLGAHAANQKRRERKEATAP